MEHVTPQQRAGVESETLSVVGQQWFFQVLLHMAVGKVLKIIVMKMAMSFEERGFFSLSSLVITEKFPSLLSLSTAII